MISSVEAAGPCRQRQVPCLARLSRVNATYRQMTSNSPGCRRVEDDRRTARVRRHLERTMHGMDCEGGKVAAHVHLITGRLYCALSKKRPARDAIVRAVCHIKKEHFPIRNSRGREKGHAGHAAAANRISFRKRIWLEWADRVCSVLPCVPSLICPALRTTRPRCLCHIRKHSAVTMASELDRQTDSQAAYQPDLEKPAQDPEAAHPAPAAMSDGEPAPRPLSRMQTFGLIATCTTAMMLNVCTRPSCHSGRVR